MNSTNVNILKLLSQGNFSPEIISLYVNVEKNSIQKNIIQINEFLKDNNFKTIIVKNSNLSLDLNKDEWENIFSRKDFITSNEILDYLLVKFIHNKFINLEVEKENLDLSRSSIVRYFKEIKKILDDSGSTYEYQSGKGVKISYISEECKNIFCKKIIKFFIGRDFNIKKNSLHFQFLSEYDFVDILEKIHFILKSTQISSTNFIISFLCTLVIIDKKLGGFNLSNSNIDLNKYPETKELIDNTMSEYDERYRNHLLFFVVSLKKQHFLFESEISTNGHILLSKLKEKFNLQNLNIGLENILLRKICISFFKYDNSILKVKNTSIDKSDKILLSMFNEILNSINRSLFFFDKISIINILKKIIIEHNKSLVQNVLLLFNEVTISDDHYLKNNLKLKAPNINFEIEPGFLYRSNVTLFNDKYDLILSDESYTYQKIKLLNSYNSINILNLIDEHILETTLNPLNL
ncbi:MAG: hypothetical protein ACRC5W_06710 [Cetobacterium sp.]|uniref:hypothetical protein n=1 Tax=Cetobacterium sp. TaxID=2071632 RepID=UPI003F2FDEEE